MIWSLWHLFQPIKMKKKGKSRFPFRSSNFICVTIKTMLSILNSSYVVHKLITNFRQLYVSQVGSSVITGQLVKNLPAMQDTLVQSLGWEDPLEKEITTHSSILA